MANYYALSYIIQIATDKNFNNIFLIDSADTYSYTPSISFNYYTLYYWHVQSKNYIGCSNWSNIWSFATQTQYSVNENLNLTNKFVIYPNPCNNNISIKYYLEKSNFVEINIIDILGNKFCLINEFQNEGEQSKYFDLSRFHNGSWTILIKANSNLYYNNFIINK
jgi:hypothetical protein